MKQDQEALPISEGAVVYIEREKCKGCALCVSICPLQAISMLGDRAFIDQERCNGCLQCKEQCPADAIHQMPENEVAQQRSQPDQASFLPTGRSPREIKKEPVFTNKLKKAWDLFFESASSPGINRKGRRKKYRGQRKRNRGRRF